MTESKLKGPSNGRKRASTPRSKTGCITCKIRRLKCGEEKPGCVRCFKSGWQCDGYIHIIDSSSASASPSAASLAPLRPLPPRSRSHSPGRPRLSANPAVALQLNGQERQYFQSFIEEVSVNLQDHDSFFWKGLALQESHTSSCIRHAIVAIGALAKSTQKTTSGYHLMDACQGTHREFALQQYQKAIRGLRETISGEERGESFKTTLISCLVLAFFDNFIGNGGFAVQHIRYARKILFNSRKPLQFPPPIPDPNDPSQLLVSMFLRLDMETISAMGVDEDRTFVAMEPHTPKIIIPTRFESLDEARSYRNLVTWEGYNFFYRTIFCNFVPREAIPKPTIALREHLVEQIHLLHVALEPLLLEAKPDSNCHPLQRPASLKLYSIVCLIKLTLSLNSPETDADALLPYFEYILAISRDTLEYEATHDSTPDHEVYTFEIRTVGPLLLLATKCRSSSLRRQAIALLLSSHRRESMYDSFLAGQVGSWMMGIEEEGQDENGFIPEEKRAWGESMELDLQRRRALVKCRVGLKGTSEWNERQTEILW